MGRVVRRVPPDWQHPKDDRGRFKPLLDGADFARRAKDWDEGAAAWAKGLRDDCAGGLKPFDGSEPAGGYEAWDGPRPNHAEYMPVWTDEQASHLMMYECTSEGTPISPAFATAEELARWLADTGASAWAGEPATYDQWLAVIVDGRSTLSAVVTPAGMESGVAASVSDT